MFESYIRSIFWPKQEPQKREEAAMREEFERLEETSEDQIEYRAIEKTTNIIGLVIAAACGIGIVAALCVLGLACL